MRRSYVAKIARAAALIAALAAGAVARDLPSSAVTETQAYANADQAAVAALRIALGLSRTFENGGFILERDGAFYYSDPVSNRNTGHIAFRAAVPSAGRLVAIYHTHPGSDEVSRLFSPDDVAQARALGVVSYIGVEEDGTARLFDPRRTPTRDYVPPGSMFVSGSVSEGVVVASSLHRGF